MIRYGVPAVAASLAACLSLPAMAADPLPTETHKVLTAALAVEAVEAAMAACKSQGYNVTVTVADRLGNPKVVIVRDGPPGSLASRPVARPIRRRCAGRPPRPTPTRSPSPVPST